ncbi:MAG: hypothetical protein OXC80_04240 [Gammaproteobacteria bacterium]|nr:hypothetical protein [Gammaproteobacteria bacterium]
MNSNEERSKLKSHIPFVYEMILSFFESARESLEPFILKFGHEFSIAMANGDTSKAPDQFIDIFGKLPPFHRIKFISACLTSTTNLGLAYVHALRLLVMLSGGTDPIAGPTRSHKKILLVDLFDALAEDTRLKLDKSYEKVNSIDLEMDIVPGSHPPEWREEAKSHPVDFRQLLVDWDKRDLLQESHSLLQDFEETLFRFLIPFRSMYILDLMIKTSIAPQLGVEYTSISKQDFGKKARPKVSWDGSTFGVSLPSRLGGTIEATWKVNSTSVIRIRETGTEEWSPGFVTPFDNCTFADLKPDTEYEVSLSYLTDTVESNPIVKETRTKPSST